MFHFTFLYEFFPQVLFGQFQNLEYREWSVFCPTWIEFISILNIDLILYLCIKRPIDHPHNPKTINMIIISSVFTTVPLVGIIMEQLFGLKSVPDQNCYIVTDKIMFDTFHSIPRVCLYHKYQNSVCHIYICCNTSSFTLMMGIWWPDWYWCWAPLPLCRWQ